MTEPAFKPPQSKLVVPDGQRLTGKPNTKFDKIIVSIGALLFLVLFVLRALLFQPFSAPSESMRPTIESGSYIWASKWNYGYSYLSIPFEPKLFRGRIFGRDPQRGDVVVFRHPTQEKVDYVKRLVGLPGDRVQMVAGQVILNGTPIKRERLKSETITDQSENTITANRYRETLPNAGLSNEQSYEVYDFYENGPLDDTQVFVVPTGCYFMLGDSRDNSTDSRADVFSQAGVGFVPSENLIGRIVSQKTTASQ